MKPETLVSHLVSNILLGCPNSSPLRGLRRPLSRVPPGRASGVLWERDGQGTDKHACVRDAHTGNLLQGLPLAWGHPAPRPVLHYRASRATGRPGRQPGARMSQGRNGVLVQ